MSHTALLVTSSEVLAFSSICKANEPGAISQHEGSIEMNTQRAPKCIQTDEQMQTYLGLHPALSMYEWSCFTPTKGDFFQDE